MTFENLIEIVVELPAFDNATLTQMTDENRQSIINQLFRWSRTVKIVPLRHGLFIIGNVYRRTPISAPLVANILHAPSYISGLWALGYYGLIPESVPVYTCIATRSPGEWTFPRITVMRFQQTELVDGQLLYAYTETMGKPRLIRAVEEWLRFSEREDQGNLERTKNGSNRLDPDRFNSQGVDSFGTQ